MTKLEILSTLVNDSGKSTLTRIQKAVTDLDSERDVREKESQKR